MVLRSEFIAYRYLPAVWTALIQKRPQTSVLCCMLLPSLSVLACRLVCSCALCSREWLALFCYRLYSSSTRVCQLSSFTFPGSALCSLPRTTNCVEAGQFWSCCRQASAPHILDAGSTLDDRTITTLAAIHSRSFGHNISSPTLYLLREILGSRTPPSSTLCVRGCCQKSAIHAIHGIGDRIVANKHHTPAEP